MIRRPERFSTMSVLVIDDEQANVDLLLAFFLGQGLRCVTSETDSFCDVIRK
jgi:CheY-like chemotaxis protein